MIRTKKVNPLIKLLGSIIIMLFEIFPFVFFPDILTNIPSLIVIVITVLFIGADIFIRPVDEKNDEDKYKTWKIYVFFIISPLMLFLPYIEKRYFSILWQSNIVSIIFYLFGMLLTVIGGTLLIVSRIIIGRFGTPKLSIKFEHKLVTNGPYKIIRNPLYLADFLLYGGFAISFGAWISFVLINILLLIIIVERIEIEERMLEETFKEEYLLWKSKTWKLIPYIW